MKFGRAAKVAVAAAIVILLFQVMPLLVPGPFTVQTYREYDTGGIDFEYRQPSVRDDGAYSGYAQCTNAHLGGCWRYKIVVEKNGTPLTAHTTTNLVTQWGWDEDKLVVKSIAGGAGGPLDSYNEFFVISISNSSDRWLFE